MGNRVCIMCNNDYRKRSVNKNSRKWLKETFPEKNKYCKKCFECNFQCNLCNKFTSKLSESYHIYPFKSAHILNMCLFCGVDMSKFNDENGKRMPELESFCTDCSYSLDFSMVNHINDRFKSGYRYCLSCNSIGEKCTRHRNPVVKVCDECYKDQHNDSIDYHNLEFYTSSAHYSDGILYDDFFRPNPVSFAKQLSSVSDKNYYQQFSNDEAKFESDDDDEMCVICFENIIDTAILPCGHTCMCETCAINYLNSPKNFDTGCPYCRTRISQIVKTYQP